MLHSFCYNSIFCGNFAHTPMVSFYTVDIAVSFKYYVHLPFVLADDVCATP